MKVSGVLILAGLMGLTQGSMALAKDAASIKILSPASNSQLDAGEEYPLNYEVTPGPGGDHFHVWVDNDRGPGVHDSKGTYTLPKLSPGRHVITIKVVDKGHVPTGPQQSINVTAK
jgi:hypothetical protein